MNSSHVVAAGGLTPLLAQVLMYLTHWPLQAMDNPTAMAFAGLIFALIGGGGLAWLNARAKAADAGNAKTSPTTTANP